MRRKQYQQAPDTITADSLFWQPDKARPPVLNRVNCLFEKGHFYGIIGPNGSGKTSLVRHLLRLLHAKEGQVLLDDRSIGQYRRRELARLLAYVPQKMQTDNPFTAFEIVMMGRNPIRSGMFTEQPEDRLAVEEAMRFTDTYELAEQPFSVLSGGESQRVMLARSIAQAGPWLFLDEPVSSLDIFHQISVMNKLKMLNTEKKKTIICVLHDINLAAGYCDRMVLMKKGSVIRQGSREEVLQPVLLEEVYDVPFGSVAHPSGEGNLFFPMPDGKHS